MGPCAEGTKTPSVVPGGIGIRAEGRHTQSAPGHKAEVIARVLAARPPPQTYVGARYAGAGGEATPWDHDPKKKEQGLRRVRCFDASRPYTKHTQTSADIRYWGRITDAAVRKGARTDTYTVARGRISGEVR